jgi:hypothetical protein
MAKAPSLQEWDYVLEEDRAKPECEQTVFRLRPLKFREYQESHRSTFHGGEDGTLIFDQDQMGRAAKVLNCGLLGWTNFATEDGAAIEFRREKGRIPDDLLDVLRDWVVELANAITERSGLGKDAAKNSS